MHPKFNDTVAALQQKIALLERKLALKQALDTPPINQKAPVETPADEVDGEKMTPEEIRAAKASVKSEQKVEEKEEECSSGMYESFDENEEESEGENGETPTPTAPCSAVAIPKKTAVPRGDKINSSTHKCEYNRLMRHMQSSATQFPNSGMETTRSPFHIL